MLTEIIQYPFFYSGHSAFKENGLIYRFNCTAGRVLSSSKHHTNVARNGSTILTPHSLRRSGRSNRTSIYSETQEISGQNGPRSQKLWDRIVPNI